MHSLADSRWRLLDTGVGTPTWNMALDEALLEGFADGDDPILRLYRWSPAAISLGRFQPHGDVSPPSGATVVRRLTGGAAIFHRTDEITYSVVAPYRLFGGRSPRMAYHGIHDLLRVALRALGVEADGPRPPQTGRGPLRGMCFDTATDYDLAVGGRKLVGSAQRRRGQVFLQHGSLPLSPDPLAPTSTSLADLLDAVPSPNVVSQAIADAFQAEVNVLTQAAPSNREQTRARGIERDRYQNSAWTHSH